MMGIGLSRKKVLVISELGEKANLIIRQLSSSGFEAVQAKDINSAIDSPLGLSPEVAIVYTGGNLKAKLDVARKLFSSSKDHTFPILLVVPWNEIESGEILTAKEEVSDVILSPITPSELVMRIRSLIRGKEKADRLLKVKDEGAKPLQKDPHTGLYTVSFFQEKVHEELRRAVRYHVNFSCLMVKMEPPEAMKDVSAGKDCFLHLAEQVRKISRQTDCVAVNGDHRLLVLAPHTDKYGATTFANNLLKRMRTELTHMGPEFEKLRLNVGVVSFPEDKASSFDEIYQSLETAL